MNFYIITFDRKPNASYKQFHDDLVASGQILKWWHYIKSSYIIGTDWTASELSKHFTNVAKANNIPTTHLVLEVNLQKRQGMLTKDAWKWIRDNAKG